MRNQLILPFLLVLFSSSLLQSQFTINGNASDLGGGCYQLTPPTLGQIGSVWNNTQVDLDETFLMSASIQYGNDDNCGDPGFNGADGIAFGLQDNGINALGGGGGGLGWNGLHGIAAAFKTFKFDEIVFTKSHPNNPISSSHPLPEDGNFHDIIITWDPGTTTLKLYFDGQNVITHIEDIKNTVFAGNNLVYWGFSAATGAVCNDQRVCNMIIHEGIDVAGLVIPTMTQWGIIILGLLVSCFGIVAITQRRKKLSLN